MRLAITSLGPDTQRPASCAHNSSIKICGRISRTGTRWPTAVKLPANRKPERHDVDFGEKGDRKEPNGRITGVQGEPIRDL
jgi:hypothetical protein